MNRTFEQATYSSMGHICSAALLAFHLPLLLEVSYRALPEPLNPFQPEGLFYLRLSSFLSPAVRGRFNIITAALFSHFISQPAHLDLITLVSPTEILLFFEEFSGLSHRYHHATQLVITAADRFCSLCYLLCYCVMPPCQTDDHRLIAFFR